MYQVLKEIYLYYTIDFCIVNIKIFLDVLKFYVLTLGIRFKKYLRKDIYNIIIIVCLWVFFLPDHFFFFIYFLF